MAPSHDPRGQRAPLEGGAPPAAPATVEFPPTSWTLPLEKDNQRIVVQAKRWKNLVGIEAVQQVIGAIKYYGAVKGMVVTNSVFTENAHDLARANGIELIDRERLIEIMRKSQGKNISKASPEGWGPATDKAFGILPDENCPIWAWSWSREKENMVRLSDARGFLCVALRGRFERKAWSVSCPVCLKTHFIGQL